MPELEIEVTQEQIDEWKKTSDVYRVTLGDKTYYYRPLLRNELRAIMSMEPGDVTDAGAAQLLVEDQTVVRATLHPKIDIRIVAAMPGGLVTSLYEHIMECSGFDRTAVSEKL